MMSEKLPNFMKSIKPEIQEAQQNPSTRSLKKTTTKHIIIKLLKSFKKVFFLSKKILNVSREKYYIFYRGRKV